MNSNTSEFLTIAGIIVPIGILMVTLYVQKNRHFKEDMEKLSSVRLKLASFSTDERFDFNYIRELELVKNEYLEILESICKNYSKKTVVNTLRGDLSFVLNQRLIDIDSTQESWRNIRNYIRML